MKTLIVTLVIFSTLMACEEENVQPVAPDPFVGSWSLSNPEQSLEVSFDVDAVDGGLSFSNIDIKYPELPEGSALDYDVELYYPFPVNTGYKEITIYGNGDGTEIVLNMIHNRIHLKTQDKLEVYILEITMPGSEPVVLENQVFSKIR